MFGAMYRAMSLRTGSRLDLLILAMWRMIIGSSALFHYTVGQLDT